MRLLELKEIQKISLDILSDVHEFCMQHDIRYSLGYGTLIGAIRHRGFIPWDDDIDIVMPRPDYERFCRTYRSARGYRVAYPENKSCYLNYARVYENRIAFAPTQWRKYETGLWIDIFPLDGADLREDKDKVKAQLSEIHKKQYQLRLCMGAFSWHTGWMVNLKYALKRLLFRVEQEYFVQARAYWQVANPTDYETATRVANKSFVGYYQKDTHDKELFETYIDVPFEGRSFRAIAGYDTVLRQIYGDYMQLPPIEKRVIHPEPKFKR